MNSSLLAGRGGGPSLDPELVRQHEPRDLPPVRVPEPVPLGQRRRLDTASAQLHEVRIGEQLIKGGAHAVFGTHDMTIVEEIRRRHGTSGYEVHMLYGIKSGEQRALAASGVTVKVLVSYGEHWFPWYVRRLAERPANVWFVVKNVWG